MTVSNQGIHETYTIRVNRASATVAYLSALAVNGPRNVAVPLDQAFQPTTLNYTATANYASVTVTPTSAGNTIKVNDVPVNSGSPSGPVNLNLGTNAITVKVTPGAGGSTTTYTITVTRNS